MTKVKRKSVDPVYSMCVQPSFIVGTNNEDGTPDFAPITWISVTYEEKEGYLLVISMYGTKMTKQNVLRTGVFSANLVSTDMLPLMDYFGSRHAKDGKKDGIPYGFSRGAVLDVPVLGVRMRSVQKPSNGRFHDVFLPYPKRTDGREADLQGRVRRRSDPARPRHLFGQVPQRRKGAGQDRGLSETISPRHL